MLHQSRRNSMIQTYSLPDWWEIHRIMECALYRPWLTSVPICRPHDSAWIIEVVLYFRRQDFVARVLHLAAISALPTLCKDPFSRRIPRNSVPFDSGNSDYSWVWRSTGGMWDHDREEASGSVPTGMRKAAAYRLIPVRAVTTAAPPRMSIALTMQLVSRQKKRNTKCACVPHRALTISSTTCKASISPLHRTFQNARVLTAEMWCASMRWIIQPELTH